METPGYIKTLLKPNGKKSGERKVWSIGLQTVWLPFFVAGNVQGDTAVPREALGAPLRLAKDKDGSVKFSKAGRPILRVASELNDQIRLVRENFISGLIGYTNQVAKDNPDGYKAEADACHEAGIPINQMAQDDIQAAVDLILETAKAEAKKPKWEKVAVAA